MAPTLRRCAGAVLAVGHVLGRNHAIGRLGRHVAWYFMCGFMNAMNHSRDLAGSAVIDVGANAGNWSAAVLELSPTSKVYANKMIPSFALNIRRRFAGRVEVFEAALSDRREPVTALKVGGEDAFQEELMV